ncbi:MAG: cupin domain-containing protein [Spirochaetota bacterium]|nr:cupin domain-containing protein [Spirochaetota bacterium]
MKICRWDKPFKANLSHMEDSLKKEGLSSYLWEDSPGTYYPTHSHPYAEVRWVVEGSITLGVSGEEVTLYPGDRLDLPADTNHYARMADDGPTIYLCASKQK